MKIAVLIMSTNMQPSLRNVESFEDTVVKYYNNNKEKFQNVYDFYVYYSNDKDRSPYAEHTVEANIKPDGVHEICITEKESVYRTFEKTYYMFESLNKDKYDLFVRINISLWLNLDLLDAVADQFKDDCIYCNAINSHVNLNSPYINDIYPRGDMYIFGKKTMDGILEHGKKYLYCDQNMKERIGIDHVDDCLVGICLIDTYGKEYYKHIIQLRYTFVPRYSIYSVGGIIDAYSIGFRVKTTPEGMYSGYSWDDNEYRLKDAAKMRELQKYFEEKNIDYSGIKLESIFTDERNSRPTLFVQASNQNVKNIFWKFLSQKR